MTDQIHEIHAAMAALRVVVLSVCVALASAFVPMAAPLSSRAVAASPAGSGIVMIRHANKLKKLNRPADQRKVLPYHYPIPTPTPNPNPNP